MVVHAAVAATRAVAMVPELNLAATRASDTGAVAAVHVQVGDSGVEHEVGGDASLGLVGLVE